MPKLSIILAAIVIGVVGLVIAGSLVIMNLTNKITETPETFTVGREFIAALSAGDYSGASGLAVSQLQNPEAEAQLQELVTQNSDILNSNTVVSLTGRGINNDTRYAYGTISANGVEAPLYMEFVDENGETRVSYFSFNADDIPNNSSTDESNE